MAIDIDVKFITVQEFKDSIFYNALLIPNNVVPDNDIEFAIDMAQSNIDYLSGFVISSKWPDDAETSQDDFVRYVKLAMCHYVRYICIKGVDYFRGQVSLSIAGISESINNPDDPLYIVPEVFNYLRKANVYNSFKGYNIDVGPKRFKNNFSHFAGNRGEDSPLNQFLRIVNLIQGKGIIITKEHNNNIIGELVTISIDESLIPDLTKYYTKAEVNMLINNLQSQINDLKDNKANKNDIPDISNLVNIEDVRNDNKNYEYDFPDGQKNSIINSIASVGLYAKGKQDKLVSGSNIKTINNESILGSGNINVVTDKQFTDEEANKLKLTVPKLLIKKNTLDEDYMAGFISPFSIVSDIDNNITRFHTDYATVLLYNKDGKAVQYIGEDIRWTDSTNNAVTLQYTNLGKLLYGETESLAEVLNSNDIIGVPPISVGK